MPFEHEEYRFAYRDPRGKLRVYTPDFFVPEFDEFVEIKGCRDRNLPLKIAAVKSEGFDITVLLPDEVPSEEDYEWSVFNHFRLRQA